MDEKAKINLKSQGEDGATVRDDAEQIQSSGIGLTETMERLSIVSLLVQSPGKFDIDLIPRKGLLSMHIALCVRDKQPRDRKARTLTQTKYTSFEIGHVCDLFILTHRPLDSSERAPRNNFS